LRAGAVLVGADGAVSFALRFEETAWVLDVARLVRRGTADAGFGSNRAAPALYQYRPPIK
jgi:hypothetical protein